MQSKNRIIFILAIVSLSLINAGQSLAGKPRGPLDLAMTTDASPAPGGVVDVTLTVTSRTDASQLTVSVELPEGLAHADGLLHWTGAAAKDQPVSLMIHVGPLADPSYEIIGRATVTLPNGSTWTQATSIVLEPSSRPPGMEKPRPRIKMDREGKSIIEIPVR
ncbi:MAG: hypothetical protein AABY46_06810 [Nitrospirota bacterium]